METTGLVSRPLTTDAEWARAARLKRDLDYAAIVAGLGGWTEPEVHALYQERWGAGEAEYQLARLREEAKDGDLIGLFAEDELVAFAAMRETNLLADEGPQLLVVGQLYILRSETARSVAEAIVAIADARSIEETDLTVPSPYQAEFAAAGFEAKVVTMRRRWRG